MGDEAKPRYARLCWLVADAGTLALRTTFDSFYSPMNLKRNISRLEMRNIVAKLLSEGRITEPQWEQLYPDERKLISSRDFSFDLLVTLLQTVCHMSSPYPEGWGREPLPDDKSLSADITRLKVAKDRLCHMESVNEDQFKQMWDLVTGAISRLGGPEARRKIHRVESEVLSTEFMQNQFIQQLRKPDKEKPDKSVSDNKSKLLKQRSSMSPFKDVPQGEQTGEGLPEEDVIVLGRTFKLLIDSIRVEDCLGFLKKHSVIDGSQKQKILSIHKNAPKMRYLINIIQKSPNQQAFKLFCESIKEKYAQVHQTIMRARDQVYQQGMVNKTDILGYCRGSIIKRYKSLYSQVTPLPWQDMTKPTDNCYVPLQILNSQGQELSVEQCLPKRSTVRVLYGPSGSGKTTLCGMITKTWTQSPGTFSTTFDLILYLDIAISRRQSIIDMIYTQILPEDFHVSKANFQAAIETNATKILFLVDGFVDGHSNADMDGILAGSLYKGCSVLLTAQPSSTSIRKFNVQSFIYCQGLPDLSIARCIKTYTNLVDIEDKPLNKFIASLRGNMAAIQTLRIPLLCTSLAAKNEESLSSLKKLSNTTLMLDNFFQTLVTRFCTEHALITSLGKMQEVMTQTLKQLKEQAFKHMLAGCSMISSEEMEGFGMESFHKLGIFVHTHQTWKYQSCLWRDYLAALHLADLEDKEFTTGIFQHKLLKLPRFEQCMNFLCGILSSESDEKTEKLNRVFTEYVSHNRRHIRGITFVMESAGDKNEQKPEKPTGQFKDFAPSLSALYETRSHASMCKMLCGSMPSCMVVKCGHVIPETAILGLASIVRLPTQSIVELDITVGKLHEHQSYSLLELAQAIGQNQHVRVLRVTWLSMTIAACFLGAALENNTSLRQVHVDRGKGRYSLPSRDTAALWAGLQTASSNMEHLDSFSFLNCPYPDVVGHIIRHLPPTLPILNISGSAFDMICGRRLASFLEHATRLTSLDISEVQIGATEFATLVQGVKVCPTLQEMKVSHMKLGRLAFLALCDSLTLTRSLQNLDLSGCHLTTEMGTRLAQITEQVSSLKNLNLINSEITQEGRSLIQLSSPRSLNVLGIKKRDGLPPVIGGQ